MTSRYRFSFSISPHIRHLIHLEFTDFVVEEHPDGSCSWDSVEIWDFVRRTVKPADGEENTVPSEEGNTLTEAGSTVEESENPQGM